MTFRISPLVRLAGLLGCLGLVGFGFGAFIVAPRWADSAPFGKAGVIGPSGVNSWRGRRGIGLRWGVSVGPGYRHFGRLKFADLRDGLERGVVYRVPSFWVRACGSVTVTDGTWTTLRSRSPTSSSFRLAVAVVARPWRQTKRRTIECPPSRPCGAGCRYPNGEGKRPIETNDSATKTPLSSPSSQPNHRLRRKRLEKALRASSINRTQPRGAATHG